MEIISCPYCGSDINLSEVEKEGGACPECGALLPSSVLDDLEDDFDDEFDEEFEDAEEEDDFDDIDDEDIEDDEDF